MSVREHYRVLNSRMKKGYLHVNIKTGTGRGTARVEPVHKLVLTAFTGPRPAGMEARHLDGTATNNSLWNLRWGTKRENWLDSVHHGTAISLRRGEGHPRTVVSDTAVAEIRRSGLTVAMLAGRYGISEDWVRRIRNGRARTETSNQGGSKS